MNRGTQYLTILCIIIGFLVFVRKRKKTLDERIFMPLMAISLGFLFTSVAVPLLAGTLNITRIYQIALIMIAPCFYLGAGKITAGLEWLFTFASAHPIRIQIGTSFAAAIMFSYLLFTSGWVWSITSDVPTSPVLDQQRMANSSDLVVRVIYYYGYYTFSEDIAAAQWLRVYGAGGQSVCADFNSRWHVLTSYGWYGRDGPILPWECDFAQQYVYLSISNSLLQVGTTPENGPLVNGPLIVFPLNLTSPTLSTENRVYSDGASIFASS
jgi:uncharacterized membrane protein